MLPTKFRFIWPSGFRGEYFLKSANQKQELSMDQDEMSNVDRGPSIDASCQVSVHLAEGFQRRRLKCEKLTDRRRTPSDGKSSHCLWQGELKMYSFYFISLYNFSFQYLHRELMAVIIFNKCILRTKL